MDRILAALDGLPGPAIFAMLLIAATVAVILMPRAVAAATAVGLWPAVGNGGEIHYIPFDAGSTAFAADDTAGPLWIAPWACRVIRAEAGAAAHTAQTTVATDVDFIFKNNTTTTTIATVPVVDSSTLVKGQTAAPASSAASLIAKSDEIEREVDWTGGSGTQTLAYPRSGLWIERLDTPV